MQWENQQGQLRFGLVQFCKTSVIPKSRATVLLDMHRDTEREGEGVSSAIGMFIIRVDIQPVDRSAQRTLFQEEGDKAGERWRDGFRREFPVWLSRVHTTARRRAQSTGDCSGNSCR